jgi:hypothetical protein
MTREPEPYDREWIVDQMEALLWDERTGGPDLSEWRTLPYKALAQQLAFLAETLIGSGALDGDARARVALAIHAGRRSDQDRRIAAIVDKARELGPEAGTRDTVAGALGRADEWGEPQSDYRRDVRKAGGWEAIRRAAGF